MAIRRAQLYSLGFLATFGGLPSGGIPDAATRRHSHCDSGVIGENTQIGIQIGEALPGILTSDQLTLTYHNDRIAIDSLRIADDEVDMVSIFDALELNYECNKPD